MLKKSLKTVLAVLLLLATSLVFTACAGKDEFKVTIKDGDTVVETLESLPSSTSLSKYNKDGYNLEGIYLDADFAEKFDAETFGELQMDITLYLKYEKKTYLVAFNTNGGEALDPYTVTYDTEYTLPTPVREGYEFIGYTLDGEDFDQSGVYTKTNGVRLFANWKIKEYSVKFIGKEEASSGQIGDTLTVKHGDKISLPQAPLGYQIENGKAYIDEACTQEFNFTTGAITADTTIYVKLFASTFNIIVNEATGVNTQAVYGKTYTITTPTREGFNFVKFTYKGEDFAPTGTYNYTTDIAITAVWEAIEGYYNRKVYFYDGETEITSLSRDVVVGEVVRADSLPNTYTKTGHTFDGWYLDSNLTNKVTENITVSNDVKFYAKITPNVYTITINNDGDIKVVTVNYGETPQLPTAPKKNGYKFVQYNNVATGLKVDLTVNYEYTESITVIPVWKELVVEEGEDSTNSEFNLKLSDDKTYFREKEEYNAKSKIKYILFKGKSYDFGEEGMEISCNTPYATVNGNTITIGNTLGTFTLTITKMVEETEVTYDRTVQIVETIAAFSAGGDYTGRTPANFNTNTVVQTLDVGINNFIPEIKVANLQNVALNFADSHMTVTIIDSDDDVVNGGFVYNSTNTGFNFDNGLVGSEYKLTFSPKYVLEEGKVITFMVKFNNGVNVYTNKELKEAFRDLGVHEINVLRNITAELDDNQYIDNDKTKGPYANETLVIENNMVNYDKSTIGNVYYRHIINKNGDNLKVHGNSFKLDATHLPRVDGADNNKWVEFAGEPQSKGRVVNHHAMIFSYLSVDSGENPRNGNNNLSIDNLAIFGNNTDSADVSIEYNNGENSYYSMSASYNAIRVRGGNFNCDNVSVRNSLIGIFLTGCPDFDSTPEEHKGFGTTAKLNNVYLENSWANSICTFNVVNVDITNSHIRHSGGAAIHFDVYPNENDSGEPISILPTLSLDANTQIENWALGTESWFVAYNMGTAATLVKTLAQNCVTTIDNSEVFNFAIFYQQKGEDEGWIDNNNFGITLGGDFEFAQDVDATAKIYMKGGAPYLNFTYTDPNGMMPPIGAVFPIVSQG